MALLKPKVIVIDSMISLAKGPSITIIRNRTEEKLNAIAETSGQSSVPAGFPSLGAMRLMAESVGYVMEVVPWTISLNDRRGGGVADYFNKFSTKRRMTIVLRAREQQGLHK